MGNQTSTLDSMIERIFPPENPDKVGSSTSASYAPLGILAFEAAAAMNKGIELWEALQLQKLTRLRQSLEVVFLIALFFFAMVACQFQTTFKLCIFFTFSISLIFPRAKQYNGSFQKTASFCGGLQVGFCFPCFASVVLLHCISFPGSNRLSQFFLHSLIRFL